MKFRAKHFLSDVSKHQEHHLGDVSKHQDHEALSSFRSDANEFIGVVNSHEFLFVSLCF